MLKEVINRSFANGKVYMLRTEDGYPLEVTDTFLPYYTKDCINEHTNELKDNIIGTRKNRWMIGVSCMSGCPVHCQFCLVPNTKILMASGEYKNIQDVKKGEYVVASEHRLKQTPNSKDYATTYGKTSKVLNTFKHEVFEELITIETCNGNKITCTSNHTIAVKSNTARIHYIRADKINIGDLVLECEVPYIHKENDDWIIGYIAGFIYGDGNIHKVSNRNCVRCTVSQSDYNLLHYVYSKINNLNITTGDIRINNTSYDTDKVNYVFSIGQQSLSALHDIFSAHNDAIDFKLGFIAGMWDTEGYSFNNNTTLRICNTNKKLLEYTLKLLNELKLGNNNRIVKYNSSSSVYILETDISRGKAKQILGLKHNKAIYREKDNFDHEKLLRLSEVVSIKKDKHKLMVYNIETDEHNYIANNIVVHNCATGQLKKWRNLTAEEIFEQVKFILDLNRNEWNPEDSQEFKINYTRMGEPFLNLDNVRKAMKLVDEYLPNVRVHHYISTIGLKGSDFSWIKDNITLQISLHSLDEERRHNLIPIKNLMSIEELGQIRTTSDLKTTVNMTLVDTADFDINILKKYFNPEYFFIKLSPINENEVSKANEMGKGIIKSVNIL